MANARYVTAAFAKIPNTIATRYYHTDVVGSVRAITDETGAVVVRHDYRPFGEDTQPLSGDPNRFAGKQLDAETAMHYFDARYYRQTWGRFSTVDPLQVSAAMTDPQQWNRYAYARNNPLKFGDPSGEFVIELVWLANNPGTASLLAGGVAAGVGAFWGGIKSFFGFGGGPKEPNPRNKPGRPSTGKAAPRTPAPSPGPPPGGPAGPGADPPDECTVNCGGPPDPPPGPTPPGPAPNPSPRPCSGAATFGSLFEAGNIFSIGDSFGPRLHPITGVAGKAHNGIDILSPQGTVLISPISGVVLHSRLETNGGGNTIRLSGDGPFSRYLVGFAHLFRLDVAPGDGVIMGVTKLGLTGGRPGTAGAGGSTGPHLHFSVKIDGVFINPSPCY